MKLRDNVDDYTRDGRFGSKVGQIGPKWEGVPNALKSDLKKPQICPICGQSDPLWSQTYHPCLFSSNLTIRLTSVFHAFRSWNHQMCLSLLRLSFDHLSFWSWVKTGLWLQNLAYWVHYWFILSYLYVLYLQ